MSVAVSRYKQELLTEIEGLSEDAIRELLDFTYFLKVKTRIDSSQAYFWTTTWQQMEREADEDRAAGRILGDGTIANLLDELKQ